MKKIIKYNLKVADCFGDAISDFINYLINKLIVCACAFITIFSLIVFSNHVLGSRILVHPVNDMVNFFGYSIVLYYFLTFLFICLGTLKFISFFLRHWGKKSK